MDRLKYRYTFEDSNRNIICTVFSLCPDFLFFFFFANKLVKIFENGWLHLKNSNWYGLRKRTISLKFFKGFLPKILRGPFLNTLIQMFLWHLPGAILKNRLSIFVKKGALKALLLENTKSKSFKESGLIFINKKAKKSLCDQN